MGVGFTNAELTDPPVPIGPAEADRLPPIVMLPLLENALTASSLLSTTTNSDMSCRRTSQERDHQLRVHYQFLAF